MAQVTYYGTGRRKTSVARVRLVPGDGKVTINGRDMADEKLLRPLKRDGFMASTKFTITGKLEKN